VERSEHGARLSASNQPGVSMVTLATRKISRISSINVQTPPIAWLLRELENQINYHNVFFSLSLSLCFFPGAWEQQLAGEQINLAEQSEFQQRHTRDRIKRERAKLESNKKEID